MYVLEVCVDSVESAVNAVAGGADRLEVCSALELGGLTPTVGLLRSIKKVSTVPIFCMLRPRSGDFVYSREELDIVSEDLKVLKAEGVDGFVFGALTINGFVDEETCLQIVSRADPLSLTFHRAFDLTADWTRSLQTIKKIGFKRILTSGQAATAADGLQTLQSIVKEAGDELVIMAGAGITDTNLASIIETSGVREVHGSASTFRPSRFVPKSEVMMGPSDTRGQRITSEMKVASMKKILLDSEKRMRILNV